MERVAQLLQAHEYRQALVRLWVLGSDGPRFNLWEQNRGSPEAVTAATSQFLTDLQTESEPSLERIEGAPLSLIRALDDHVASTDLGYNRAARFSGGTLAFQEDGKGYWLVPVILQARRCVSLSRQAVNLSAWFHRHAVLPTRTAHGLLVNLSVSQSKVAQALSELWLDEQPTLKVWIAHFNDEADVQWTRNESGNWRTTSVEPKEVRNASILEAVSAAAEAGAHIIVFPEFTLDMDQRSLLANHLYSQSWHSLLMVVAGSFHETVGTQTFNTAPLYDSSTGECLLTHRKLRIFGDIEFGPEHGAEQVDLGNSVQVLATPIGCITVLICKDFIDVHASVESLLTEVPVDWVLVPSFGDEKTIKAHKERAKALATIKSGTHTVVAQTLNTAVKHVRLPSQCVRGFGHAAGRTEPEPQVGENGGLVSFVLAQQQAPLLPKDRRPALKRIK